MYHRLQRFHQKPTKLLKDKNIKKLKRKIFYFYFFVLKEIQNSNTQESKIHSNFGVRNSSSLII